MNQLPNLLIVDDTEQNLALLEVVVRKVRVNLIKATSGPEALEKTLGVELALAIIDVRMPQMDGFELARKLNEIRPDSKVPIIFLTANYDHSATEGYDSGAVDYIYKPMHAPILLSKINVFLDLFNQKQIIVTNVELLKKSTDELIRTNEALRKREEKLQAQQLFNKALLDSIPGIFYLYTYPELRMVTWNKQHETLFGFESEEMEGRHVLEWHLPENHDEVLNSLDGFMDMGQAGIEANLLAKDGHSIPFLLTAVKFESQGQNYLIGVGTDISEQKQAEVELRVSKTILTKAQQIAHVGSWEYDYKSDRMKCSDETFRIFGFEPGEVEPTLGLFYNMVHRADFQLLMDKIEDVRKLKIPLSIDLRILYSNGVQRFIHEQAEITFDSDGLPVKWIGTVHDITQRKNTEEELQKSLEQLHQLSKHIEQARESERLNIARDLHDDLGQALTAVKIDLGIIKQNVSGNEVIQKINAVSTLVGETIKTVQRLTSQLRPEIIDDLGLHAAIKWYTKEFAQRNGIEIDLDMDSGIPTSPDDSLILFRIMQESLTNISRHSGANHIDIKLIEEDGMVNFRISDDGVGITENEINSKKSFGIIGMKERASSLAGTCDIYSENGNGTIINLIFPLNKMEA